MHHLDLSVIRVALTWSPQKHPFFQGKNLHFLLKHFHFLLASSEESSFVYKEKHRCSTHSLACRCNWSPQNHHFPREESSFLYIKSHIFNSFLYLKRTCSPTRPRIPTSVAPPSARSACRRPAGIYDRCNQSIIRDQSIARHVYTKLCGLDLSYMADLQAGFGGAEAHHR